jgi:membrane-associated protein
MDGIIEFFKELVNPESIILYGGIYLLLTVVFVETGLFVGFFLPGDSLLFTAGLLCATGILQINPLIMIVLIIIAAVAGNMVGYIFGKKVGVLLFKRKSGIFFRQDQLAVANEFYKKLWKENNYFKPVSANSANFCTNYSRNCKIGIS